MMLELLHKRLNEQNKVADKDIVQHLFMCWTLIPDFTYTLLVLPTLPRPNQQMAEIDLEMALMSTMSHREVNDLQPLIRLVPLVSMTVAKAVAPWKDAWDAPALTTCATCLRAVMMPSSTTDFFGLWFDSLWLHLDWRDMSVLSFRPET